MKTFLKWLGMGVGTLVGIALLAAIGIYIASESQLNKTYSIPAESITLPTGAAALERGEHFVKVVGACVACHGENLGGGLVFDEPIIGTVYAPNLTAGQGGRGATFTNEDFVRAIRYGVRGDGKAAWVMPSNAYYHFSDADLGAVIAYVKSQPAVNNETPASRLGPLGRTLMVLGQLKFFAVERIDPTGLRPSAPPAGVTAEYGQYLVQSIGCNDCHGTDLAGGIAPGSGPDDPPAPNLTPGGELQGWTETDFATLLRTLTTPNGRKLTGDMPPEYGGLTDDEISAVWLYLRSLPPIANK
jgi:mono/diheme cytochrome c family protein